MKGFPSKHTVSKADLLHTGKYTVWSSEGVRHTPNKVPMHTPMQYTIFSHNLNRLCRGAYNRGKQQHKRDKYGGSIV